MGKKLYVGNLPFSTTDESLQSAFSPCGQVESARVVKDRDSGRSKGFGFVEMSNDEEANVAIEKLNGTPIEGRNITVAEAKPQEPRAPREGGFRSDRGGDRGGRGGDRGGRGGFGGGGNRY